MILFKFILKYINYIKNNFSFTHIHTHTHTRYLKFISQKWRKKEEGNKELMILVDL